jgi:hypothetical protein
MSPNNDGNWCCGICGKDSKVSTLENPPDDWKVIFFIEKDSVRSVIPLLACEVCKLIPSVQEPEQCTIKS